MFTALLCALCAVCVAFCSVGCDATGSQCVNASVTFKVKHGVIANSWQSSNNEDCFRDSVKRIDLWNYFYSDLPDKFGYHWLLIELTRPIRVRSVTVVANDNALNQAENIEIFLSDRQPPGLTPERSCYASIDSDVSLLTRCGATRMEGSQSRMTVTCRAPSCTEITDYILLRRFARMNFKSLEIEKVSEAVLDFSCRPSNTGSCACKMNRLSVLTDGQNIAINLYPPCLLQFVNNATCRIESRSGSTIVQVDGNPRSLVATLPVNSDMQGGNFTCSFNCPDGPKVSLTEPIGHIIQVPRNVSIEQHNAVQIGSRHFLAEGTKLRFTFVTEAAYPKPVHFCKLASSVGDSADRLLTPSSQEFVESATAPHTISLKSEYRLNIRNDMSGKQIFCASVLKGACIRSNQTLQLPELVAPIRPELQLPPASHWKHGDTVTVTLDFTNLSQVPTICTCLLETPAVDKINLPVLSITNSSTNFRLVVSKSWGSSGYIRCLVNQSGIAETWQSYQLPHALFRSHVLLTGAKISVSSVLIFFSVTEGFPSPIVNCSLLTNTGTRFVVTASGSEVFLVGQHSAEIAMNKSEPVKFTCSIKQGIEEFTLESRFPVSNPMQTKPHSGQWSNDQLFSVLIVAVVVTLAITAIASVAMRMFSRMKASRKLLVLRKQTGSIPMTSMPLAIDPNTVYNDEYIDPNSVYDDEEPKILPDRVNCK